MADPIRPGPSPRLRGRERFRIARFLFTTIPAYGHLPQQIAVARRLQDEGHTVAFAVHPRLHPPLARAGLEALHEFTWGQALLDTPNAGALRDRTPWDRGLHRLFANLGQGATVLAALLRQWQADVLISSKTPIGAIAAEASGLPYATTCGLAFPLSGTTLPPYGPGISPYARPGLTWLLHQIRWSTLAHSGDRTVNRARRAYGLPPVQRSLFVPSPYLLLTFTTELFEYRRPDLPPQVWFVGPAHDSAPDDGAAAFPWDRLDAERPLVYAALGDGGVRDERVRPTLALLRTVVDASRDQPWQTVISLDLPAQTLTQPPDLPPNVIVAAPAPCRPLLEQARVVICSGADMIVTAALCAGTPMLVLPEGGDQSEVAQRVVEAGAGLRLTPRGLRSGVLQRAIARLLNEPGPSLSARRIAADFARCDGPGTAAALLVELAEVRRPIHRALGQAPTCYVS